MTDIQLHWRSDAFLADMSMSGPDLTTGQDLATAVIVSLFSWRRARPDDPLPDYHTGREGWWGDTYPAEENDRIGSRLWLLKREKLTLETVNRAIEFAEESLQWLIEDRVASRIEVTAERRDMSTLAMSVAVYRFDGTRRRLDFGSVWEAIQNG